MIEVLALALLGAGLLLIISARETAKKVAAMALTVGIGALILRCLVCRLWCALYDTGWPSFGTAWLGPMAIMALTVLGAIAWKTRGFRQRRLDELRRRHMHPRRRAPPPPPAISAGEDGPF